MVDTRDPAYQDGRQWYLKADTRTGLRVSDVWNATQGPSYSGDGVTIQIIEVFGFSYEHADLIENFDTERDYNHKEQIDDSAANLSTSPNDAHGTSVASLIAADDNANGMIGAAPDTTVIGHVYGGKVPELVNALEDSADYEIVNMSLGHGPFVDNFRLTRQSEFEQIIEGVKNGRDNLGTIFITSAGNDRDETNPGRFAYGADVNHSGLKNSTLTITVGAVRQDGTAAEFSTPGASVLVSAPGEEIYSAKGLNWRGNSTFDTSDGTSFAAPLVSGVVALMLEANPQLGYRDVQEILAYSARPRGESTRHDFSDSSGRSELGWEENGAHNWNAGGLNFNHRYGFGTVDAFAAVRLAETWRPGNDAATYANLERLNYAENGVNGTIPDGTSEFVDQIRVGAEGDVFEIDHLELFVDITHPRISDLVVKLTSPSGTESLLLNRPFKNPDDPAAPPETDMSDLKFTLASVQHWGEMAGGTWTLSVADRQGGEIGTVNDWHLTLYGDKHNGDDHYVFTDDFALVTGGTRGLVDPSGVDTINISPISDNVTFFLNPGSSNIIGESILKIGAATVLENVYAGDGNDTIFGNAADNTLHGGRGNDVLAGAGGADFLRGGPGNDKLHGGPGGDWLEGGPGADHFRFMLPQDSNIAEIDGIMGFKAGVDKIDLSQMDANPGKLGHQQFDFYGRIDLEWWEEDGNRITDDYIDQALVWWQETDEQGDWTYIVGARTKDDGNNADDFAVVLEGFHAIDTDSFAANSLIAV